MGVEENLTRKGVGFYFYYFTIFIFIFFVLINYFLPVYSFETININLMISIVTFLFGFLITISFSMIWSRISSLKSALAIETGRLVSLFELSKFLGKEFSFRVLQNIDNYTVNTLRDYVHYEIGRESIYSIYEDVPLMEIKNEVQKNSANSFLYVLGEWETLRETLEYLTRGGLLWTIKFTNYLLASVLVILLFLSRGDVFMNSLFIVLSTIIVFILLIIEDYEDLRIGDYTYNISNSEQIFDLIGANRYYPKNLLGRVELEPGKVYRVGVYDKKIKKEKVVNMKYNPSRKI